MQDEYILYYLILLAAGMVLAMAFTFSCSSSGDGHGGEPSSSSGNEEQSSSSVVPSSSSAPPSSSSVAPSSSCGVKLLKSTTGWIGDNAGFGGNGTDQYGFSALPGGLCYSNGSFIYAHEIGGWWSASEDCCSGIKMNGYDNVRENYESNLVSVRCVED
jgi:hypothetical protein